MPEKEAECIASVKKFTHIPYKLTAYDNFEKDEALSKVWNDRIRESDCEYICLLNNDTIVSDSWLSKMYEIFCDVGEKVGAVGAISNCAGGFQGGYKEARPNVGYKSVNMLSGFCLMFPKKVWHDVGGFDETFHLYGEDNDFCRRIKNKGYQLYLDWRTFIFHYGRSSTPVAVKRGKDIDKIKKESSRRYQEIWNSGKIYK